jgi:hypothetical protein
MSCDVLLHDCTRHTCNLPLLTDLEANCEADLHGLSSFAKAITKTQECALDERA